MKIRRNYSKYLIEINSSL